MDLANNLNKYCKSKNLTITQLSRLSGVKQSTLHGWTTGRSVHKIDDLQKVCSILKVGLFEIFYSKSDPYTGEEQIEEFIWGKIRITITKIDR
jgi:transcriptional regulator with XRE-family HTH domain